MKTKPVEMEYALFSMKPYRLITSSSEAEDRDDDFFHTKKANNAKRSIDTLIT